MRECERWQHGALITNGVRLHYVSQGEGPLVVLLHGFPEFWYSWRWQIPFLAQLGYKVVAPDLRGYNDSDKPHNGYDIPTLLLDIVGLIRGLGYEKALIVGHDWGGVLAWAFAQNYPSMTERLIVMNAPHPAAFARELRHGRQLQKSWYAFAFQIPFLPELALGRNHAELLGNLIYAAAVKKEAFPPEVILRYRDAMSKPRALTCAIQYYRALMRAFLQAPSRKRVISAPTLLIWGEQDIALGLELTEGLEPWVPNLQVRRIADSGHWVQQEQPEQVNALLAEFLPALRIR